MNSYFDLLVLAALFVPVALMVVANLATYRLPDAGHGPLALPAADPEPATPAAQAAEELPELRHAA